MKENESEKYPEQKVDNPQAFAESVNQIRTLAENGAYQLITPGNFPEIFKNAPELSASFQLLALSRLYDLVQKLGGDFPAVKNNLASILSWIGEEARTIAESLSKEDQGLQNPQEPRKLSAMPYLLISSEESNALQFVMANGFYEDLDPDKFPILSRLTPENLLLLKIACLNRRIDSLEEISKGFKPLRGFGQQEGPLENTEALERLKSQAIGERRKLLGELNTLLGPGNEKDNV